MRHIKRGPNSHAQARDGEEGNEKVAQKRPADGSPDQAVNAEPVVQNDAAEDDAGIINNRAKRGNQELLAGVQDAHHQAAQEKEHLRGKQNACQRHGQADPVLVKAGVQPDRQRTGIDPHHANQQADKDEDGGRDNGNRLVRRPIFPLLPVLGQDGNNRGRQRAALEQVKQQIGDGKGRVVGICLRPAPEIMGNDRIAQDAENARQQHRRHHQTGRPRDPGRLIPAAVTGQRRDGAGRRLDCRGGHRRTVYGLRVCLVKPSIVIG